MSELLSGLSISNAKVDVMRKRIAGFKEAPKLVIIQVGDNPESATYIKHKKTFAERIGARVEHARYPADVGQDALIQDIEKYNADRSVHGIIIQLPIPSRLVKGALLEAMDPEKDVDGMTPTSIKRLFDNEKGFLPATTRGVLELLSHACADLVGKKVTIVGESSLVGRPIALALLNRKTTVTVCHRDTKNLAHETRGADILIVAAGVPKLIRRDHVSSGQIVIDIGITVEDSLDGSAKKRVSGDVDFVEVKDVVRMITPVPGGVGPMTVACLFENLIEAYEHSCF